eukprot:m.146007 g.146007  ORF g.146007 m.146007 type:complete len:420 (+) comp10087_c0_seq6:982-2241(+)
MQECQRESARSPRRAPLSMDRGGAPSSRQAQASSSRAWPCRCSALPSPRLSQSSRRSNRCRIVQPCTTSSSPVAESVQRRCPGLHSQLQARQAQPDVPWREQRCLGALLLCAARSRAFAHFLAFGLPRTSNTLRFDSDQRRMSAIDYSKWDKLDVSSSEDEEEMGVDEDNVLQPGGKGQPRVYKLDHGQTVHIPGRNVTVRSGSDPAAAAAAPSVMEITEEDEEKEEMAEQQKQSSHNDKPAAAAPTRDPESKLTQNGGSFSGSFGHLLWSQDAEEVSLAVAVPAGTRAKAVAVSAPDDRHLRISVDGAPVFEEELFAAIETAEAPDWEILDWHSPEAEGRRIVRATMRKAKLGGIILWWRSATKEGPQIDTSELKDRPAASAKNAASFMESFAKAQEMFREKMAQKKRDGIDDRMVVG